MQESPWDAVATPLAPEDDAALDVLAASSGWDAVATTPPRVPGSPPMSGWDAVATATAPDPLEIEESHANDDPGPEAGWDATQQRRPRRGRPNQRLQEALQTLAPQAVAPPVPEPAGPSLTPNSETQPSNHGQTTAKLLALPATALVAVPASWIPPIVRGFTLPTASARGIIHCWQQVEAGQASLDDAYLQIEKHFVNPKTHHLSSRAVTAQHLQISQQALEQKLSRLAATQVAVHRLQRLCLEATVTRSLPSPCLIAYSDAFTYDETPLKAAIRDSVPAEAREPQAPEEAGLAPDLTLMQELIAKAKLHSSSCKILQTRQCFGLLVAQGEKSWSIRGDTLTPLQVLERNTAEVVKQILQTSAASSPHSQGFQFKARVVCTDRAGANIKAERSLAEERGPAWQTLHTFCDLHAVSSSLVGTFDGLLPEHVTGLIRCALSLREGPALACFRRCLREEIAKRLVIRRGQPPSDAQEHKKLIFHIFFSAGGKQSLAERMILAKLPNGDWRNRREVEYYIPDHLQPTPNKKAISRLLEAGLSHALVGKKPSVWARHRWTGADRAVEELGRLECVHGLLRPTYKRFIHSYKGAPIAPARPTDSDAGEREEATGQVPLAEAAMASLLGPSGAEGSESAQDASFQTPGPVEESSRTAEEHAKDRQLGSKWLSQDVLPFLMLLRMGLSPVSDLMYQLFAVTSESWELQQQAAAGRALNTPQEGVGSREYMVTVATQGHLEQSFFGQLQDLWLSQLHWTTIPEVHWTVRYNALIFKVFSRLGCMVEQRIEHPHSLFPLSVFQIPHNPQKAQELSEASPCLMDGWTRQLLRLWNCMPN